MNIEVKHNKDWWDGGISTDESITGFAEKCGLKPLNYNSDPRHLYLLFRFENKKQVLDFKGRLKRSKKLANVKISITCTYDL